MRRYCTKCHHLTSGELPKPCYLATYYPPLDLRHRPLDPWNSSCWLGWPGWLAGLAGPAGLTGLAGLAGLATPARCLTEGLLKDSMPLPKDCRRTATHRRRPAVEFVTQVTMWQVWHFDIDIWVRVGGQWHTRADAIAFMRICEQLDGHPEDFRVCRC